MRLPNDTNLLACLNAATSWVTPGRIDVAVGTNHGLDGELVTRTSRQIEDELVGFEFHVTEDAAIGAAEARITHGGATVTRTIGQGAFL